MNATTLKHYLQLVTLSLFLVLTWIGVSAQQPYTVNVDGVTTSNNTQLPFCSDSSYSYTQQIYLSYEINFSGDICRMSFYKGSSTEDTISQFISISLGHVSRSDFNSQSDWEAHSALENVFTGEVTFHAGWNEIVFNAPFTYNGTQNLLVAVYYADVFHQETQSFRIAYNQTNRSLAASSNTGLDISSLPNGERSSSRNHVKLTFNICSADPMVNGIEQTCVALFSDPGGNSDYGTDLSVTRTFVSDNGQPLVLEFYEFSLSDYDCLYIYDGASTSSPLLGTFMGNQLPDTIESTGSEMTLFFTSNGVGVSSGWIAGITCKPCSAISSTLGSPCDGVSLHPFCTEAAPDGLSYPSGTGGDPSSYFGTTRAGCISFSGTPSAWYYMRISQPGNLLIYMEQHRNFDNDLSDLDFACWGPFTASTPTNFKNNLCCERYELYTGYTSTHRPFNGDHSNGNLGGYPVDNMIDCSFSASGTEWCFIPNAQVGEFYLLLITNWARTPGVISFNAVESHYTTAETDCSVVSVAGSNSPLCEGNDLLLYCANTEAGSSYYWEGPNGFTSTERNPVVYGVTLADSGIYTLHLHLANGDTASTTVSVEVNPVPDVTVYAYRDTLCANDTTRLVATGADSYRWNTSSIDTCSIVVAPSTPTYFQVVGTINDCSSTVGVYVYTHPPVEIRLTQFPNTFCPSQTDHTISVTVTSGTPPYTYQWSGDAIQPITGNPASAETNISADYLCDSLLLAYVTVIDSFNCVKRDTSAILIRDVDPPAIDSGAYSIMAICQNGQYIIPNVSGLFANITDNCMTNSEIVLIQTPASGTVITQQTEVIVRAYDQCGNTGNFGRTVVMIPSTMIVRDTSVVHVRCYGESTGSISVNMVDGYEPVIYQWSNPSFSNNSAITNLPAGTYHLTVTDECGVTIPLNFNVRQPDSLQVNVDKQDISCDGEAGFLQSTVSGGTSPYSYSWNDGSASSHIRTTSEGWFEVTVTDDNNCFGSNGDSIVQEAIPVIVVEEITKATCHEQNGSIRVSVENGTPPVRFNWSNGSTNPYEIQNLAAGNYSLQLMDANNCLAEMNFVVEEKLLTVSIASIHHAMCNKNDGSIEISINTSSDHYDVYWNGIEDYTDNAAFNLLPGNYMVSVNDGICIVNTSFTINSIQSVEACLTVSPSPPNFIGDPLHFIDCSRNATYWQWDFGDGNSSSIQHPGHQYDEAGRYEVSVYVRDVNDCKDSVTLTLIIENKTSFFIPNAFSPNGDGLNDLFKPKFIAIDLQAFKMSIYDRWGTLVFYTENPDSGWDGTINGELSPIGTVFVYIIQYRNHFGKTHVAKGEVVLVR